MDVTGFLTAMAALSTAVQTLVDQLIKGRSGSKRAIRTTGISMQAGRNGQCGPGERSSITCQTSMDHG